MSLATAVLISQISSFFRLNSAWRREVKLAWSSPALLIHKTKLGREISTTSTNNSRQVMSAAKPPAAAASTTNQVLKQSESKSKENQQMRERDTTPLADRPRLGRTMKTKSPDLHDVPLFPNAHPDARLGAQRHRLLLVPHGRSRHDGGHDSSSSAAQNSTILFPPVMSVRWMEGWTDGLIDGRTVS